MISKFPLGSHLFSRNNYSLTKELDKLRKKQKIIFENCRLIDKYTPYWSGEVKDGKVYHDSNMPYKHKKLLYGIWQKDGKMTEAEREFEAVKEFENAKSIE